MLGSRGAEGGEERVDTRVSSAFTCRVSRMAGGTKREKQLTSSYWLPVSLSPNNSLSTLLAAR